MLVAWIVFLIWSTRTARVPRVSAKPRLPVGDGARKQERPLPVHRRGFVRGQTNNPNTRAPYLAVRGPGRFSAIAHLPLSHSCLQLSTVTVAVLVRARENRQAGFKSRSARKTVCRRKDHLRDPPVALAPPVGLQPAAAPDSAWSQNVGQRCNRMQPPLPPSADAGSPPFFFHKKCARTSTRPNVSWAKCAANHSKPTSMQRLREKIRALLRALFRAQQCAEMLAVDTEIAKM